MHYHSTPEGEMSWIDLVNQAPCFKTVEGEIARLTERVAHTVTQMPRPEDPGYAARMQEAYDSTRNTIADIASDPEDLNVGMRLGYLWAQVIEFTPFILVDGEEVDLERGPRHLLAAWPAIVAGRYRQMREVETGEGPLYKRRLADINAWVGTGGYGPNPAEQQAAWGPLYEEDQLTRPHPTDGYQQEPGEATRAFLERIERHYAQAIGGSWNRWTRRIRRHLAKCFLGGLQEAARYGAVEDVASHLADKSWAELTNLAHREDQPWPSSGPTPVQDALGTHDTFQQTVFALQQYAQDPWMTPDSQASSGSPSPSLHASGNHFIPFNPDQTRPYARRRRRRRRAKGDTPPPSEQRLHAFRSEVSAIKQVMSQMVAEMNQVNGRLRAPWGPPPAPPGPNWAEPLQQVTPAPPSYPQGCGRCTRPAGPTPAAMARYPDNPNQGTRVYPGGEPLPPPDGEPSYSGYHQEYAYPGDEPYPPPDEAVFDSGYERDPAPPPSCAGRP